MSFRQCCNCISSSQRRFTLDTVSSICHVQQWRFFQTVRPTFASKPGNSVIDFPDMGPPIPEYKQKENEDLQKKRARLFYQSRYCFSVCRSGFHGSFRRDLGSAQVVTWERKSAFVISVHI